MNASATATREGVASTAKEPLPVLQVMIAYADGRTRERALHIYDQLLEELSDEYRLEFTWWTFDLLNRPQLFETAVAAAVGADLIVFSVHASEELPAKARAWLEAWRNKRERRPRGLLAFLGHTDSSTSHPGRVHTLLQGVAEDASMEFFPHAFPLLEETPCCLAGASERLPELGPVLEEILTHPSRQAHWGLND